MAGVITAFSGSVITTTGSETSGHSVIGSQVSVELVATPVTGTTPSATFSVQWSDDGTNFAALAADTFPAITTAGNYVQSFAVKGQYFKLAWTVTGTTPSFTVTALAYS